ncbi:hypothetical protein MBEBAB_2834 [Brevundimonas abyssalis TAR-001]|uniref:Uncharacterized protein n=1 Tax=Brevundimonas abyssalis TAR-001 TaxID=1391729 RepID=A0A8E0NDW4_9CAUL|nr:hypothetical protein MBEBAB_2834 [Brevundimonas abyssalis TAR-001]
MLARVQDVDGVALVAFVAEGAEHLAGHDLGEAVDGVQRGAQFVAHIGQELALGLIGRLGAHHGLLVLPRQLGQFLLALLQLAHGQLQSVGGLFALHLLTLDDGDVGGRDHGPAVAREALGHLQPAAVGQLDLAHAGAAGGRGLVLADGQGGDAVQLFLLGAPLEVAGLESEGVLESLVPQDQPAVAVEQDEGVRHAFDGVAQAVLGGLGLGLGASGLGDVQGHAHEMVIAVRAALARGLAAQLHPQGRLVRGVHAEGDLHLAVGLGLAQGVLHRLTVPGIYALDDLIGGDDAAPAEAEHARHDVGHHHLVPVQVPFPDAAARGLDGGVEASFGVGPDAGGAARPAFLEQHKGAQPQTQTQRADQDPGVAEQGHQAPACRRGGGDDGGRGGLRVHGGQAQLAPGVDAAALRVLGQGFGGQPQGRGGLVAQGGRGRSDDEAVGVDDADGQTLPGQGGGGREIRRGEASDHGAAAGCLKPQQQGLAVPGSGQGVAFRGLRRPEGAGFGAGRREDVAPLGDDGVGWTRRVGAGLLHGVKRARRRGDQGADRSGQADHGAGGVGVQARGGQFRTGLERLGHGGGLLPRAVSGLTGIEQGVDRQAERSDKHSDAHPDGHAQTG